MLATRRTMRKRLNKNMNHQPFQPTSNYTDYRLASAPSAGPLNLLKFHTSNKVDLTEFAPPVRLYRKRPEEEEDGSIPDSEFKTEPGEEDGGKSSDSAVKDKKTPPTAAVDTTVIAPYGNAAKNKTNLFRKKTRQVYQGNPEARKVREQEKQPWVLEDYDGTHSWQGKLEGGQQSNYVMLVFAEDGFKVVPASKWYKFTPKIQYTTLTLDEAEEQISKQQKKTEQNDRWLMRRRKTEEGEEGAKEGEDVKTRRKLKLTDRDGKRTKPQVGDVDEMDFEEVFEDDEEGGFLPELQDEEAKESMERQKREAQKDRMSDEEADEEQNTNLTRTGKEMRKLVRKMEKNTAYESDEERDPYAQSGDEEEGSDMELEEVDGIQKDQASTSALKSKKPAPPVTKEKGGKTASSSSSNTATATSDVGKRKLKPSSHGAASSTQPKKLTAPPRSSSSASSLPKSNKSSRASSPAQSSTSRGNSTPIHSSSSSALAALRAGRSASPPAHTAVTADSKRKRQHLSEEDPTDSQASTMGVKKVKLKLGNTATRDRSMSMSPPPPSSRANSTTVPSNAPSPSPPSPPSSTTTPTTTGEINPVQFEQELVDLIGNNTFSTKDLILRYKKVLRNASSKELVVGLIKKVASSHSGYLTLRDEFKSRISR